MSRKEQLLAVGIACAAALPPLAMAIAREQGFAIVLYRAPKELAFQLTAWVLVVSAALCCRQLLARCRRAAANPPVVLLMLWIAWSAGSGLWATTPALWRPNLIHWITAGTVLLVLIALLEEPRHRVVLLGAWCGAAAFLTLLGAVQALGLLPLPPIDPEIASTSPATWGWKNPAAHFIVGQLFLVGSACASNTSPRIRRGLMALLLLEVVYLLSLQSRTALVACALGVGVVVLCLGRVPPSARRRALAGLALVGSVASVTLLALPASRDRLSSVLELLTHPATFLESDRGQYLRSTLLMVRDHPFGVGLGSWQSEYPVHRVGLLGATAEHEVRRAHSDWIQALGEGGWIGLALWAGFWLALSIVAIQKYRAAGASLSRALLLGQVAAAGAAGMTDYVVEMPVFRFYLVALVALVVARDRPNGLELDPGPLAPHRVVILGVTTIAALHIAWATGAAVAADREARLLGLLRSNSAESPRIAELSDQLRRLPMATATEHRVFLATAARALAAGDLGGARRDLDLATTRSPWNPRGFELRARLAELEGDADRAERWRTCRALLLAPRIDHHPQCHDPETVG